MPKIKSSQTQNLGKEKSQKAFKTSSLSILPLNTCRQITYPDSACPSYSPNEDQKTAQEGSYGHTHLFFKNALLIRPCSLISLKLSTKLFKQALGSRLSTLLTSPHFLFLLPSLWLSMLQFTLLSSLRRRFMVEPGLISLSSLTLPK